MRRPASFIGDVPFVLQDFPLVTNVQMSVPVIRRIVERAAELRLLKHEDWPGLDKITALRAARRARPPHLDPLRQWRHVPARGDGAAAPTAP